MGKITNFLLITFLIFSSCEQKNREKYNNLIVEARDLYQAGEYGNSGEIYSEAFKVKSEIDTLAHHYEAAQAWALAGEKDLAFEQLFHIANKSEFTNLRQISTDKAFIKLNTDGRWINILTKMSENLKRDEARLAEIATLLETVQGDDQYYRQQLGGIQEKFGHDSKEYRAHWEVIQKQDSINLIKVTKILDEHGWLGWNLIGRPANKTLFLVIQHADVETQKKYLPMLREAVKKGDAAPAEMALLEDRIALRMGKKQIYGSQIGMDQETGEYYVSPLEDPDNVNQRRAQVGLEPIQDYIIYWGLTWDVEAYKMNLQQQEKQVKE